MKLEYLKINNTARKEEILAYILCKDYVFGDKMCIVGDQIGQGCPDVYSEDKQIGVEVVMCETFKTFKTIEKNKIGSVFANGHKKVTKINTITGSYNKHYNNQIKRAQIVPPEEEYKQRLIKSLNSKIENLNCNSYSGCKQVYLVIISCFAEKDYINNKEIFALCKEITSNYPKQYEKIFIFFKDRTLSIDKAGKCKIEEQSTLNQQHQNPDGYELEL